jgi:23S rRNA C2498 (ribose-2'-O)-methylase RlmM
MDDNVSVTLSTIDHQTSESLSSEDRISIIMKKMAEVKQHIKDVESDADFDDETRAKMLAKFVERKNELAKELIGGGTSEA